MKLTKGLTWPFLVLSLLTTLVFMAGLASLQNACGSLGGLGGGMSQGTPDTYAAFGMSDSFGTCSKLFRFYWFTFAFVTLVLLSLLITTATHMGLHFSRPFWVGMITISILLMMIASEAFLGLDNMFDRRFAEPWWWHARLRTATAGAIMSVASLIGLLMAVGTDWERTGTHRSRRDDKVGAGHHPASAATTPTTAEHAAVPVQNVRMVDQV